MSIELCNSSGLEAANVLTQKLVDPDLAVKVGGIPIGHILRASHSGDGLAFIEFAPLQPDDSDDNEKPKAVLFQFSPSHTPFAETAVNADGQPICSDC